MKTISPARQRRQSGFSLVEAMVTTTIVGMAMAGCVTTFIFCLKIMYRDGVRLQTNAALRYFTAQMAKETVDASEFYLLPDYTKLDGNIDIDASDGSSDLVTPVDDGNGTMLASGDCIVLVTRTSLDTGANVRQIRIYYRVVTAANVNNTAPIRYYEVDYGTSGSASSLTTLLNTINLNTTPSITGSRQITATAKGRRIGTTNNFYPIFCSEGPVVTATNESFSINVEFINGNSTINMLSSSSFNYTVSPRR